eukprot:CAMPEP_0172904782 /NCGR_PEP_ID=MMETSP1075-20121228/173320_1 /TAXON_ID=2916 /ORGANISM="Ceratium fusus, Strain PA161109" /LENGTH=176 /DNA_ID=CAMNT_0013761887 /DNA_START=23 /DNA_END=550 /DNA_ORIENTATION=+
MAARAGLRCCGTLWSMMMATMGSVFLYGLATIPECEAQLRADAVCVAALGRLSDALPPWHFSPVLDRLDVSQVPACRHILVLLIFLADPDDWKLPRTWSKALPLWLLACCRHPLVIAEDAKASARCLCLADAMRPNTIWVSVMRHATWWDVERSLEPSWRCRDAHELLLALRRCHE